MPAREDRVVDPLVNPVWHALGGPQAAAAETKGAARRYRPDISPFTSVPDLAAPEDWDALRALVGPGEVAFMICERVDVSPGWDATFELAGVQMVLDAPVTAPDDLDAYELTPDDVPDMLALVERTRPGPFRARTIELGTYLGVRVDGALVAMAGERMRPSGYTEISAVCTDDGFRGRGLASALTRAVAARIVARREVPILHAAAENVTALRLYETLGFRHSRPMQAKALRAPA